MNRIRILLPKKYYLVSTGKWYRADGRNFVRCCTLSHALAVYKRSKVAIRQIDVRGDGRRRLYTLRWGRR